MSGSLFFKILARAFLPCYTLDSDMLTHGRSMRISPVRLHNI